MNWKKIKFWLKVMWCWGTSYCPVCKKFYWTCAFSHGLSDEHKKQVKLMKGKNEA